MDQSGRFVLPCFKCITRFDFLSITTYSLQKSNPLPEEEKHTHRSGEPRRRNIFQEQLRAEHESFKAVFDKKKHRIGRLDVAEE